MLGSIVDQAQQVAIILLRLGVGAWHKDQLLTKAAPSREPGLCIPGVSVYSGECLHDNDTRHVLRVLILTEDMQPLMRQLQSQRNQRGSKMI